MMDSKPIKIQNQDTSCAAKADCCGNKTRDGLRREASRRDFKKRGTGVKDHTDKSMGIVTLIVEAFAKIKLTEPLRFTKRTVHSERDKSQIDRILVP
jgi:hypothetical protein